ncbi:D-alanyl-D-alanine carboxypeptidase family protein [Isoptericola aurantiacus]|uniref:D-alanyl-D-alanine carboxypeptidase family protein n=1 Tax=Isoptericola aurantiacus TaxID=3377839 RepID=UPI00383B4B1D
MNRPRFVLPRHRQTRPADGTSPAPRRTGRSRRGAHAAERAPRATSVRGPRAAVAGAMALLTITAGAATALSPDVADAETSATATADPEPVATLAAEAVMSADPAVVRAASALQAAEQVTSESTTITRSERRRIEQKADDVVAIMDARDDAPASRASDRTPLVEETAEALSDDDDDADADADGQGADTSEEASLARATKQLDRLVTRAGSAPIDVEAAPDTPAEITAAEAAEAADAADHLADEADSVDAYANGQIPSDALCELSFAPGETLRCDAGEQLERLDVAYRAQFGEHLDLTDSYRSYASQVATRATRGYLAAVPGYSNHGLGVAVDLGGGVESFGTARYDWLRANAPKFGWDNPGWARSDGSKPEAWHWEYDGL